MKKIYIIVFLLALVANAKAQTTSGDITSDETWSSDLTITGTVYVKNDATLTIDEGVTVSLYTGASIVIENDGNLIAEGSASDSIIFTAYSSSWGHLSIENTDATVNSTIKYCIIEKGNGYNGGGIYIRSDNIEINHCIIRNNTGSWGGGIHFDKNLTNPTISNSIFTENTASRGGGGVYVWTDSYPIFTNCIISDNNHTSSDLGGGGVYLGTSAGPVDFYNCTIANNTTNGDGSAVYLVSTKNAEFFNSIIYGRGSNLIVHTSTTSISDDFNYCAIVGSAYSDYTNCIELSETNADPNGPNFIATDGSNWSIQPWSPCVDEGTTVTGVPANDFHGNSRIGDTDIGAYECQFYEWQGDYITDPDDWNDGDNWNAGSAPTSSSTSVYVPYLASGNYPTGGTPSFTIGSGYTMIIAPGAQATFGSLSNNGTLRLESDANSIFSLILTSSSNPYQGSGDLIVELFLKGGTSPDNMWHYIAAPPLDINKSVITDIEPNNLLRYDDSDVSTSVNEGWQWHDGYDGSVEVPADSWSTLEFARGYNFYHSTDVTIEYTPDGLYRNLGEVTLQNSSGGSDPNSLYGLNLLGNSLSCSIDWDEVSFSSSDNVRNAIYMTTENTIASYVNGVSTNGGSNIIPPLQGFFVRTINHNESIDFTGANVNVHGTQARYKGKSIIPLVRLEAVNAAGNTDEMVVRFDYNASDEFDSKYDASKILSKSLVYPQIYSYIGNEKYSINGINFPDAEKEISLGFKAMEQGNYTISATEIQGVENYDIYLTDTYQNNYTVDLKAVPDYNFTSDKGTFDDRFLITIGGMATGFDDIAEENDFNMYTFSGQLNIQNMSDEWSGKATVNVYDLTGRLVSKHPEQEIYTGETIQLPFNNQQGIYIIEITNGTRRTVQKLSHR